MEKILSDALYMFSLDVVNVVVTYILCGTAKTEQQAQHLSTLDANIGNVKAIASSPDRRFMYINGLGVQIWDSDHQFYRLPSMWSLLECDGIAVDHDRVFVTHRRENRVSRIMGGKSVYTFGRLGRGQGFFMCPSGIAVDGKGLVFVVDSGNDRVQVFNREGCFVRTWGSQGDGVGQFRAPSDIAIHTATGLVWVSDTQNHRVQAFDTVGTFVRTVGSGRLSYPRGVAIDKAGQVIVCDSYHYRVQIFQSNGTFVTQFDMKHQRHVEEAVFKYPSMVCVDDLGRILVASPNDSCVQVFGFAM